MILKHCIKCLHQINSASWNEESPFTEKVNCSKLLVWSDKFKKTSEQGYNNALNEYVFYTSNTEHFEAVFVV